MAKPTLENFTDADIRDAFKNMHEPRTCTLCEKPMVSKRRDARFCSNSCRAVYHRLKASLEAKKAREEERAWLKGRE